MDKENRKNFTIATLKNLPLPAKGARPDVYYDTQIRKLIVMVSAGDTKSFYVSKKIGNKAVKLKLGVFPEMSVENARKAAEIELAKIACGINPQHEKRRYRKQMTFGHFFTRYCEDSHKESISDDKKYYRLYLEKAWANKRMSEITFADVDTMHKFIGDNHGHYAANHTHSLIRTLYNAAITKDTFTGTNPAKGVTRYPEKSRDIANND